MKKNYILVLMLQTVIIMAFGQNTVTQIVLGNGGIYGNDIDHVGISGIDPSDYSSSPIGEVVRESIQDLIVVGDYAFVAAEDSLVKFDLTTNIKMVAVYHGNLSRLYYGNDMLYVSLRSDLNGPPMDGKYLKAFDQDLNLMYEADGISTDVAGMCQVGDSIYIAVSGDWQATEGILAVASSDLSYVREMNLGSDAVGIIDLFAEGNIIYTINKSPYGATSGSVSTYDVANATWSTKIIENVVGKGVKKIGNLLYLGLDYGIGSYDLNTSSVINNQIIADPGSASYINIAAALYDEINEKFYVTITDYFSMGEGIVYDKDGLEIGGFEASVSAEAMAIHYNDETSILEFNDLKASLYPNPASHHIHFQSLYNITKVEIYNQAGQLVLQNEAYRINKINIEALNSGFYMVKLYSGQKWTRIKLFKP